MLPSQSKFCSKVTTVIKTYPEEVEQYEWEIKVDPNLMTKGTSPPIYVPCEFSSGLLSIAPDYLIEARIYRQTRHINFQFTLPIYINDKKVLMKPFLVQTAVKGQTICSFQDKFPEPKPIIDSECDYCIANCYCKDVDLSSDEKWTEEVDTIKITWSVAVHQQPDVVTAAQYLDNNSQTTTMTMLQSLSNFYDCGSLSDVTISCGDQEFPAHRLILAMSSPILKTMFETDMKEKRDGRLVIDNSRPTTVTQMLQWIYTGQVEADNLQDLIDLFKVAHRYEISSLKDWCVAQIPPKICANNALEMYELWETFKEETLTQKALQVMKSEKVKVFATAEIFQEFTIKYPEVAFELMRI